MVRKATTCDDQGRRGLGRFYGEDTHQAKRKLIKNCPKILKDPLLAFCNTLDQKPVERDTLIDLKKVNDKKTEEYLRDYFRSYIASELKNLGTTD